MIIGAHLDWWDLGTGATDNGTGVVAAMEALRATRAIGVAPRRTIRVVLFSGEEQGHWGSKAYVRAHTAELGVTELPLEKGSDSDHWSFVEAGRARLLPCRTCWIISPSRTTASSIPSIA